MSNPTPSESNPAVAGAIGIALLIIFLAGPADPTVKLAIVAGVIYYFAKSGH